VRLRLSRQLVEGGRDPLVDTGRIAVQAGPEATGARGPAGLQAGRELVSLPHLHACAVVVRDRVERAVEAAPAQCDGGLELVPGSADVRELVADADELNGDL